MRISNPPRPTAAATAPRAQARARRIAVVAFDGISPFHLAVPCLVFGEDRRELGVPPFQLQVCAAETGTMRTSAPFSIVAGVGLSALQRADIVIVPSWRNTAEPAPTALLRALRQAHERGATIVGLCLGAFVVAEAGLLQGKAATTHWHWAQAFADRFPQVRLDPSVLYVEEGHVITSAGTAASLDCCLHLLRRLCGTEVANRVARRLVVAPHRQGGQAQFIERPVPSSTGDKRLADVLSWVSRHLNQPHSVDSLAQHAAMSRRTFTRSFQRATGTTALRWLLHQRLMQASRLLEASNRSIETIAGDAGFGSAVSMRQHFTAAFGVSPAAYRKQFHAAR
jgi:transcriptional regulator GlxA family with amidase domain